MVPNEHTKLELIQAQVSFIPDGWTLDKVGATLQIRNNFRKPISQEVRSTIQGEYPYYGPTRIQDYISEYEQDGVFALIGEDGDHFLKYSTMQQTQFISGKCTVNNHAHILESTNKCDSEWFYIFFKHRNITNFLSRQGAGRFKLNKATLEKLPMLVPPIQEQRKIAKILSTWDKAISTTERLIDNSKQQKKALMQQLLTGKKRLLDDSGKPFEGEWVKTKLIETASSDKHSFTGGPFGSDLKSSDYKREGVRIIQLQNIGDGQFQNDYKIFTSEEKADKLLSCNIFPGEIILSKMGDPVARATIIPSHHTRYLMASDGIRLKVNAAKFDTKFIHEVINSPDFRNIALSKSTGSTRKRIGLADLKNIAFLCPQLPEQQKIATVLANADRDTESLKQQLADLKQEKKGLMQQLLTGKRRVKA